jgi:hypothetical protein
VKEKGPTFVCKGKKPIGLNGESMQQCKSSQKIRRMNFLFELASIEKNQMHAIIAEKYRK